MSPARTRSTRSRAPSAVNLSLGAFVRASGAARAMTLIRAGRLPHDTGQAVTRDAQRAMSRWHAALGNVPPFRPAPDRICSLVKGGVRRARNAQNGQVSVCVGARMACIIGEFTPPLRKRLAVESDSRSRGGRDP
jgi:hypothetical protein